MIFGAFKMYRDVKKGTADPTGFAFEQVKEPLLIMALIPVIVFIVILILLGILGFTDLIIHASGVARAFFWIFIVIGVLFGLPALLIGLFVGKVLKKGENLIRPHATRIQTKVETVVKQTVDKLDRQ